MRLRTLLTPLLAAAAISAGAVTISSPAAALAPDPAVLGTRSVTQIEYDAGDTRVTDTSTGVTYNERLQGRIYLPSGGGPFPVLMFLHGRHGTCAFFGEELLGPPQTCPDTFATENVRSYQGYGYLASNLASHGYLVVSASANAINSFDWAGSAGAEERAQVIARTLDLLYSWNTTAGPGAVGTSLNGKSDLSSIGLMGHSRGGEGVNNFVDYNRTRTDGRRYPGLKAVFALAPTDFAGEEVQGVHFATLLPLCDGDVYDLQGSQAYDRGRFITPSTTFTRAQYTLSGANHNWFNTIWTGDDYMDFDGGDPSCTPGNAASTRLTDAEQRDAGLAIMASFFRRWVGGDTAFENFLQGAEAVPASACPGSATTCPNLLRTSWLSAAANRNIVVTPNNTNTTTTGAPVTATGFTTFSRCTPTLNGTGCPTNPTRGIATQYTLKWNAVATFVAPVSTTGFNATGLTGLTFRTGMNYNDATNNAFAVQNFDVVIKDVHGATSNLVAAAPHTASLRKQAGTQDRELMLDGVWIPMSAFTGIDKSKVTSIELRFGTRTATGSIQLAELGFQK